MLTQLVSLTILLATSHAQSVKSCGGPGDHLQNAVFSISPDPIVKGQPVTITATGTLDATFSSGSLNADLTIKALGIVNEPVKGTVPFSVSPGFPAGPQKVVIGPFSLPSLPGSVDVQGKVTATAADGKEVLCIALDLSAVDAAPLTQVAADPVTDCGTDADHLKDRSISTANNVTTVSGTLDESVAGGTVLVDLSVKVSIIKIPINMNIPFTISPAIAAGALKATFGPVSQQVLQSSALPPVDVSGTVKLNDPKSEEIACIAIDSKAITQELVDEINSKQSSWTAHMSPRFETATLGDIKKLCGTVMKGEPNFLQLPVNNATLLRNDAIPSDFDSRKAFSKCADVIGRIRDQSSCGSCWAFGSTEAFNDRHCIATGDQTIFAADDTNACCSGFTCGLSMGCGGGQPSAAWRWFKSTGVVTGEDYGENGCRPYSFPPCAHHVPATQKYPKCPSQEYSTPKCGKKCTNGAYKTAYEQDKTKATSAYSLNSVKSIQTDIMTYGPVTAAFTVYSDFPTYKSGVYHHTTGSALGGHAIEIIGWGVESGEDYWLVKNSWNDQWGDQGLFKIRRGNDECGIEGQVSAGHVSSNLYI